MRYFLILGKNPSLSSAEIAAVFKLLKISGTFLEVSSEAIVFQTVKELEAPRLMLRLGGTVKIGEIICELTKPEPEDIIKVFKPYLAKKIYFGFSFYKSNEEISNLHFRNRCQKIKNLAMPVKELLRKFKIQARWVTSKELNLSSVVVKKNKLLTETGAEIVFLIGKDKIYFGKTLAVQEFEELSFRDYGRPVRSMRVGLMPPKLAKIMINLAGVNEEATILDPFCGFGTILGEAMLLGYRNIIGSDINLKILAGAKENLEWLIKNYELRIMNYKLLQLDVRRLSKRLSPCSVDAIITEPYLGPLLSGDEPQEKIEQIIKELSDLYLAAFREFKKILKPNGRIVILFPVFHTASGDILMPILEKIKKIGFNVANPLPNELKKYKFLKITPRNSIFYFRPGQFVRREILIFKH